MSNTVNEVSRGLKECAHCGGPARRYWTQDEGIFISCHECGIQTMLVLEERQAVEAWNLRHGDESFVKRWARIEQAAIEVIHHCESESRKHERYIGEEYPELAQKLHELRKAINS